MMMMSGKRLLEKPRFELAAVKGVFRLGRCYILQQGIPSLWASNWESTTTDTVLTGTLYQTMFVTVIVIAIFYLN